jgi:2'-5' RNA ligase
MFSKPGDTALVLFVPEADPAVCSWREAHDPSAAEGMPAHITVLYPFVADETLNDQLLGEIATICGEVPAMGFTFSEFGRFPGVLWLKPDTTLCSQLVTRVRTRWPECLPYGRSNLEVIPHLTITDGASEAVAAQAQADVGRYLPLEAAISAVTLVVFDGRAWVRQHEFTLGPALAPRET